MIVWKLDAVMRERRVKGRQLAKRMGIGENYLSRVRHEVPDRLSLALLDGLCRELGCGIADLLEYRPTPSAEAPVAAPAAVAERVVEPVALPEEVAPPVAVEPPAPAPEPVPEPVPAPVPEPVAAPARAGFVLEIAPRPARPAEPSEPVAQPPRERPKLPIMPPLNAPPPAPEPAAYVKGGALQAKLERLKRRRG